MPEPEKPSYLVGLDLGQAADYSAFAVLERTLAPNPKGPAGRLAHYACRMLERFQIGTPYTAVCDRMVTLFGKAPLQRSTLVVDATGVGRPVVDMLRRAKINATLVPVTITAGQSATPNDAGGWNVPKRDLAVTVQVLLQGKWLVVSKGMPEAATLRKELQSFKVKVNINTATESFESYRERDHDDLVLAVAIAAWRAERCPPGTNGPLKNGGVLARGVQFNHRYAWP